MASIPDIAVQIEANQTQRTPCILVLDGSGSMQEEGRIGALNAGLKLFQKQLQEDPVARVAVQVLVIRFGDLDKVEIRGDWTDAMYFAAPTVEASGTTPMGEAMLLAISKLEEIKQQLRDGGVTYTRPWVFLMTDGGATDPQWQLAAEATSRAITERKFLLWPIAIGSSADIDSLRLFQETGGALFKMENVNFRELFIWISSSLSKAASTPAGGSVQVAAPPMMTLPN